ncbi:MAG: carbohydrate binding family 9 domain-containing protein [Pseudomonadales bacterium]|nr:carbohydrate binding family 9 domain-containing protein [Pseudomonadales bacterium]
MFGSFHRALLAGVLFAAAAGIVTAQDATTAPRNAFERKSITIPRTSGRVVVDGKLDDSAWQDAVRLTDATQYLPQDGAAPSEATEFWLMYDADTLYIAAKFDDRDAASIKRAQLVQGQAVFNDDFLEILLDTYNNKRTGYILYVNPNGVQRDGLGLGGMAFNMDWDGIWDAAAQIDSNGWTAEVALPFKTFSFDRDSTTWGINLLRSIRRKNEEIAWSHHDRQINFDLAGEITGLTGLRQGRGVDIVPAYALTTRTRMEIDDTTTLSKPSLDAFWRVTPSLRAAITLNTDFSATEVDDRQVNLTRFSQFFPEKRDFFLDDAEIFEFATLAQNGRPFFSRTIGLSAGGQPIDLDAGAKLTGRIGRYSVGALAVRQEPFAGIDAKNLLVARAYANILDQSTVGAIVTSGDPKSNGDNTVLGVDFTLRDRLRGTGPIVEAIGWAQRSSTSGLDGDDAAFGLSVGYPNDRWSGSLGAQEIQENFRPALGFVNRTGIRQYDGSLKHRRRFADGRWRSWLTGIDAREITDQNNVLQSRYLTLLPFTLETRAADAYTLAALLEREVLPAPFQLPGGLIVAPGDYSYERWRIKYVAAGFRKLAPSIELEGGDFLAGKRFDTRLGLQYRPNEHVYFDAQYQTNALDMPSGRFTARIYTLAANLAFNVNWAWLNVTQYDNFSGRLGVNSRLRWLPAQGQAAYLVLNYDWREDFDGGFKPVFAETTLKFNYTFRF